MRSKGTPARGLGLDRARDLDALARLARPAVQVDVLVERARRRPRVLEEMRLQPRERAGLRHVHRASPACSGAARARARCWRRRRARRSRARAAPCADQGRDQQLRSAGVATGDVEQQQRHPAGPAASPARRGRRRGEEHARGRRARRRELARDGVGHDGQIGPDAVRAGEARARPRRPCGARRVSALDRRREAPDVPPPGQSGQAGRRAQAMHRARHDRREGEATRRGEPITCEAAQRQAHGQAIERKAHDTEARTGRDGGLARQVVAGLPGGGNDESIGIARQTCQPGACGRHTRGGVRRHHESHRPRRHRRHRIARPRPRAIRPRCASSRFSRLRRRSSRRSAARAISSP